ncbi:MAG: hypothetical protein WCM76_14345 [Bacteroidota bacterium]
MSSLSLKEHIAQSRLAVDANKAKGNRHAELLSGLYADSSRFLEELLQNTEDAYRQVGAANSENTLLFRLFSDRLEVSHNGKCFDEDDLKSITTFANTTKSKYKDVNLIGKFGIGFKSVFAITNEPQIHSGNYHFKIRDYEVLEEIVPLTDISEYSTSIVLPFKNDTTIYKLVEKALKNLGSGHLLFLDRLNCLEVELLGKANVSIRKTIVEKSNNCSTICIGYNGNRKPEENFLLLKTPAKSVKGNIAIAFHLEHKNEHSSICSAGNTHLFSWFPTLQETGLQFFVHAPFTTTPTREFIPFDIVRTPENIRLAEELSKLFVSSLTVMRDSGYLSPEWLAVMPLTASQITDKPDNSKLIYTLIHKAFNQTVQQKKFLPSGNGAFCKALEACLIEDKELTALLGKKGMNELFGFDCAIDNASWKDFPEVKEFLISTIRLREITTDNFAFRLSVNPGFLQKQKAPWFIRLYYLLLKHPSLWDSTHASEYYSLRNKEIILTKDGSLKTAFDSDGTAQLFPFAKHGFKIHSAIRRDMDAMKFLSALCENVEPINRRNKTQWQPDVLAEDAPVHVHEFTPSDDISIAPAFSALMQPEIIAHSITAMAVESNNIINDKVREWAISYVKRTLLQHKKYNFTENTISGIDLCFVNSEQQTNFVQVLGRTIGQLDFYASPSFLQAAIKSLLENKCEQLVWIFVEAVGSTLAKATIVSNPLKLVSEGKIKFLPTAIKINEL